MRTLLLITFFMVPVALHAQGGQPSLSSVTFQQATVAGGTTAIATITISAPAGNNGFDVTLSLNSNAAQLGSSSITIGSGQSSGTVAITTTPTATLQLATLTASARNDTRTANLTIAPPVVSNISASPSSLNSGQQSTGTVTINGPAPSGGMQVSLSSNNSALTVPASVTVPSGQTSATFSASTGTVTTQTQATVTAATGTTTRTAGVTVLPAAVTLGITLPFNPISGQFKTRAWNLSAPAPPGGAFVHVSTTGVDIFQMGGPFTDTIPAGQTSIFFSRGVPVTNVDKPYEVIVNFNGVETRRSSTLKAPGIAALEMEDSIAGGQTASLRATLNAAVPSSGLPVTITSNNSAVPSPGEVSGIGGSNSVTYRIPTNPVAARQTVELTVARGSPRTISFVLLPAAPVISSFVASPTIARPGQPVTLTVVLDRSPAGRGIVVGFTVPPEMSMPTSVFIPAGTTTATVQAMPLRLVTSTTVSIRASVGASNKSVGITINP
jgi:trimeric autotransporter adhesin